MIESSELESRLTAVEKELAELRAIVRGKNRTQPWYKAIIGSMKDFPEFEEVVRLGREQRQAIQDPYDPAE